MRRTPLATTPRRQLSVTNLPKSLVECHRRNFAVNLVRPTTRRQLITLNVHFCRAKLTTHFNDRCAAVVKNFDSRVPQSGSKGGGRQLPEGQKLHEQRVINCSTVTPLIPLSTRTLVLYNPLTPSPLFPSVQ